MLCTSVAGLNWSNRLSSASINTNGDITFWCHCHCSRPIYDRSLPLISPTQGKNVMLPEHPEQVNFDCGHVDFCWTGLAGIYFLLSFGINISPTTPLSELSTYCHEITASAVNWYKAKLSPRLSPASMCRSSGTKWGLSHLSSKADYDIVYIICPCSIKFLYFAFCEWRLPCQFGAWNGCTHVVMGPVIF